MNYNSLFPTPEDNKKANKLCWISLACVLGPFLVETFLGLFVEILGVGESESMTILSNIVGVAAMLSAIAGFVLMVYVRVKYPKNVFGKVLMWVYITSIVLMLIAFIVLMITCSIVCGSFMNDCGSCYDSCIGFY